MTSECWCGIPHAFMDIDQDGNPFDLRDDPSSPHYDPDREGDDE